MIISDDERIDIQARSHLCGCLFGRSFRPEWPGVHSIPTASGQINGHCLGTGVARLQPFQYEPCIRRIRKGSDLHQQQPKVIAFRRIPEDAQLDVVRTTPYHADCLGSSKR